MGGLVLANLFYAVFVFWLLGDESQWLGLAQLAMIALISALSFTIFYRFNKREIEMKKAFEEMSANDKLTGLSTRTKFSQTINGYLSNSKKVGPFALMMLDIDRFKEVNTTLGYNGADELLKEVGNRLVRFTGQRADCARLSGNEFAVLVRYDGSGEDLQDRMQGLLTSLYRSYICDGRPVDITISGGVSLYPEDGLEGAELTQCAQFALQRAKQQGNNKIFCYEEGADEKIHDLQLLSQDMDRALKNNEFKLFFQPQFSFATGEQVGFEALIRWEHPERGLISPADFILIAEENGFIIPLSEFALLEACKAAVSWRNPLRVAVNLSPVQMQHIDIAELTRSALEETGLDPARLELEVTESLFINISDGTADMLKRLQQMGVTIALDDFGTGYSSLNYLSNFPFDKLKIDRSFVKDLTHDQGAMAIISAVIGMAKSLEMRITAEGIDNKEALEILKIAGCHEAQGFQLGKPRDITIRPGVEMEAPGNKRSDNALSATKAA
jgi:diguanylate cyclase (GGDEF)-like protein